jgi:Tol biopolymer transport system component
MLAALLSPAMTSGAHAAPAKDIGGIGDSIGLSPFWDWKTIETPNFRVTFPVELTETAERAANILEEAHAVMSPVLHWQPSYRAQITLIDNADAANGLTTPVLREGIILYVTPPDGWFSTAYYDDWLRLLIFHEYTHFLNMDATRGIYTPLRWLLGDVVLPNSLWPSWMLEGLAVFDETRFTHSGRGRSPYYDMILRSAAEGGVLDSQDFVTIDRVNGDYPWYPGGETVYLFGYELMNEAATKSPSENPLGEMSLRSSWRVPYFINGNLSNIIGRDWYDCWRDFTAKARERANGQLARIRSQPVTPVERLSEQGYEIFGPAVSPDGKLVAYTRSSPDRRSGLFLRELETGKTRLLGDKELGVGMAFLPDSRTLVYSALERERNYYLYSELEAIDVTTGAHRVLTSGSRARDPDVSRDGKLVAYTTTDFSATTGLTVAQLVNDGGKPRLENEKRVYWPARYDRVSGPKFSADGRTLYFSLHPNGKFQEDLYALDLATGQARPLVADGHFNRQPAIAPPGALAREPDGAVYFVSDATGVDNVYRYSPGSPPALVTNVTTGLWFPAFDPKGTLYASAFSYSGFDLARVSPASAPLAPGALTLSAPSAPAPEASSDDRAGRVEYPVRDYSVIPSIWPRAWVPLTLAELVPGGVYLGGEVYGFDATDRHRYLVLGGYNTGIPSVADVNATYENRMLGPTISVTGASQTDSFGVQDGAIIDYARRNEFSASVSFPFQWTYSTLTPRLAIDFRQESFYLRGGGDPLFDRSAYVPAPELTLSYTDAETSTLALVPEEGTSTVAGAKLYLDGGVDTWKGLLLHTQYYRLFDHVVLSPSVGATWTSRIDGNYIPANVNVDGRLPKIVGAFYGDSFDQLDVRGYPFEAFYSRAAVRAALDLTFPIARVFRGWGTQPLFFDNVWGNAFAEETVFPGGPFPYASLPSAGGGLNASLDLFIRVPVILSLQYQQGFREELGGVGDLFFELGVAPISF